MPKYVAFLRGINVGGNKLIKMEDLRKAFESIGFTAVKTVLASGNVLFEAPKANVSALAPKIEKKLADRFKSRTGVVVRTLDGLQRLSKAEPFKNVKVTPQTRLYVTFLSGSPTGSLKVPYVSDDKSFTILRLSAGEVYSVVTLSDNGGTLDLMAFLDKQFGKRVTTRSWNTIQKLTQAVWDSEVRPT